MKKCLSVFGPKLLDQVLQGSKLSPVNKVELLQEETTKKKTETSDQRLKIKHQDSLSPNKTFIDCWILKHMTETTRGLYIRT